MDISQSFSGAMDRLVGFLPNLVGFLVLLLLGYVAMRIVQALVRKLLERLDVDRHVRESGAGEYVDRLLPGASAASAVARAVSWLVLAFFVVAAIGVLGIPAVTAFMNQVLAYLPNVVAALAILIVAGILAGLAARAIGRVLGHTPAGPVVGTVVPALVMVIAMFMVLQQLRIAEEIVQIAFAATMGALALGLGLAFGLGGRGVAERMLEDAYRTGRQSRDRAGTGRRVAQHTDPAPPADPTLGGRTGS